jgi:hypothetical protein
MSLTLSQHLADTLAHGVQSMDESQGLVFVRERVGWLVGLPMVPIPLVRAVQPTVRVRIDRRAGSTIQNHLCFMRIGVHDSIGFDRCTQHEWHARARLVYAPALREPTRNAALFGGIGPRRHDVDPVFDIQGAMPDVQHQVARRWVTRWLKETGLTIGRVTRPRNPRRNRRRVWTDATGVGLLHSSPQSCRPQAGCRLAGFETPHPARPAPAASQEHVVPRCIPESGGSADLGT